MQTLGIFEPMDHTVMETWNDPEQLKALAMAVPPYAEKASICPLMKAALSIAPIKPVVFKVSKMQRESKVWLRQ
jgi:hypothetical protein